MTRILIAYGTRHGQTKRVVDEMSLALEAGGHNVDTCNLRHAEPDPVYAYDAVLVAASVHAGGYEREVRRWVRDHVVAIDSVPNAFVSVSLSAANDDEQSVAEMDAVLQKFRDSTGWHPDRVVRFGGALVYSRYNWLLKRIMRSIVRKREQGEFTDMSRDYDLTDFDAVRTFARTFGEVVRRHTALAIA